MHTVNSLNSSIWRLDRTIKGTTTPSQSRLGSYVKEEVLHILQSSKTEASPSHAILCDTQHMSSIWPIDETQTGTTTLGLSVPRSDGNKEVVHIPQSSRNEASPSNSLVSYSNSRHSLGGSLTTLQRCSQCILQPPDDLAGSNKWIINYSFFCLIL